MTQSLFLLGIVISIVIFTSFTTLVIQKKVYGETGTLPGIVLNDIALTEGNSGGKNFIFTVTRSGNTTGTSSVNYSTSVGTASSPSDYTSTSGTVNFAANETTKTVTVVVNGDISVEADETFFVNLLDCIGCSVTDTQGVGTILNDDAAPANVSVNDVSLAEGNSGSKNFIFTVTRSGNTTGTSSVNYSTSVGTASSPSDYSSNTGTLSFATGETTKTVTIVVNGDSTFEPNETFSVNLSNCVNCSVGDGVGVGIIINDDLTASTATITINDVSVNEGNSGSTNFVFTVTRSGVTTGTSSVSYSTANGAAISPSDYTSKSGTLSFAAGVTSKTVTVVVNGDTGFEPSETFSVNLSSCVSCTISDSQGVGTIRNDDAALPTISINDESSAEGSSGGKSFDFTVTRSGNTAGSISVKYVTANGAATSPSDYTSKSGTLSFAAGDMTKKVSIIITGDTTFEPNETFFVNLSSCVSCTISDSQGIGTIRNDDAAPLPTISIKDVLLSEGNSGSTNFVFTLTRSGITTGTSSVNFETANVAATSPSDYAPILLTTINFKAGETTKTVTVPVYGDTAFEPNETFFVNLSTCVNCAITDSQGVGTILNDDVALPTVSIKDVSTPEGNSRNKGFDFVLTRTANPGIVSSVDYAIADGSTTAGSDYASASGTVIFAAGETTKTITILVNGDTTVEPNETFNVNLSNCIKCTIVDGLGVGTILNDDNTPLPTISINDVSQQEGNSGTTSFVFTVTRSGITTGTSSVSYATANGAATPPADYVTVSPSVLKFAANEVKKTVTVAVKGDITLEPSETFSVNLSNCVNCVITDGQGVGTIKNDDLATADLDADGVPNAVDRCPNQAGSQASNGCPITTSVAGGGKGKDLTSTFLAGGFLDPIWILPAIIIGAAIVAIKYFFKGRISLKFVKRQWLD